MAPRLAGQLRFRITSSPDPASFSAGTDLKRYGLPWRKEILAMGLRNPEMTEYHALLSDGLISEDTLSICKTAIDAHKTRRFNATSRVLFAFGQPFDIRFGRFSKFYVIDTSGYQERIIDVLWVYPFNENGPLYRSTYTQIPCISSVTTQPFTQAVPRYAASSFRTFLSTKARGLLSSEFSRFWNLSLKRLKTTRVYIYQR